MGYDCGFDIFPPLKPTEFNRNKYQQYIGAILDRYGRGYEDREPGYSREDRVALVIPTANGAYIEFEVGERPRLPFAADLCQYFLRFSSKISGGRTARAEPYVREVAQMAREVFGDRVKWWHQQLEDGDQRKAWGYYNWTQVHAAQKKMMAVLGVDGYGELGAADAKLLDELDSLKDEDCPVGRGIVARQVE